MDQRFFAIVVGFSPEQIDALQAFGGVHLQTELDGKLPWYRLKPLAIRTAFEQFSDANACVWMDSDCFVNGDLSPLLASASGIQIRLRGEQENASVFRHRYQKHDRQGSFPESVTTQWIEDVGDLDQARLTAQPVANCFSISRDHQSFIDKWDQQMQKVLAKSAGVVDSASESYFMTDESVLASLLAFSNHVPPILPYCLDEDPKRLLLHLGTSPKPWIAWQPNHLRLREEILIIVRWAEQQGLLRLARPHAFREKLGIDHHLKALFYRCKQSVRVAKARLPRQFP